MPSYKPYLEVVFSQQQWTEIARSIGHDDIPLSAKQEICGALFEYTIDSIKPETRERFVEDARQFRAAASRILKFLRGIRWHDKIEELIEEIYQLQRFVDNEFDRRPKKKGGRPASVSRDALVDRLKPIYECLTGNKVGQTVDPATGKTSGSFVDFVASIFQLQRISLAGIKHVIPRLNRDPKNPR